MISSKKSNSHNKSKNSSEKLKSWKEIPIGGMITDKNTSLKNKTGTWRAYRPVFDASKCVNCMTCVFYCPDNAIPVKKGKKPKRLETNLDYCKGCGICASVCPTKAITMKPEADFNE
ncbi:MAG: 4Fe-4S dicluster domain-containing protein [Nitrospiraceae bacterium]|nr:4Fe-4S dicluster domain-containing protein [Nitrospiraceae bacterium]